MNKEGRKERNNTRNEKKEEREKRDGMLRQRARFLMSNPNDHEIECSIIRIEFYSKFFKVKYGNNCRFLLSMSMSMSKSE